MFSLRSIELLHLTAGSFNCSFSCGKVRSFFLTSLSVVESKAFHQSQSKATTRNVSSKFMKKHEITKILIGNSDEKLSQYLSILLEKCKDIAKESNVIAVFMLLLILLYYLADFSQLESLQIGPVGIKDVDSVKVFVPLVFAFLILRYIILSAHKAELHRIVGEFSEEHFGFEDEALNDGIHLDDFTRSILPFSIYSEVNNLTYKGKSKLGCFGAILILPITAIAFVTFILEFYWIRDFLSKFESLNFTQKTSVVMSIWIILISIYYFIHNMIIKVKENK